MKPQLEMNQIIESKRYDCSTAILLAGDDWWDGHNFERGGHQTFLFRTPKGRYFFQYLSQWQGSQDHLSPCEEGEAQSFFEGCQAHDCCRVNFDQAFPHVEIEDA